MDTTKILVLALHGKFQGYVGGGWIHLIESFNRMSSFGIMPVILEYGRPSLSSLGLNGKSCKVIKVDVGPNIDFNNPKTIRKPLFYTFDVILPYMCFLLPRVLLQVQHVLKDENIGFVYCTESPPFLLIGLILSFLYKRKVIVDFHLAPIYGSVNPKNRRIIRFNPRMFFEARLRSGDKSNEAIIKAFGYYFLLKFLMFSRKNVCMVTPSDSVRSILQRLFKKGRDTEVHSYSPGNGVNLERISSATEKVKSRVFDFVTVMRLEQAKGAFDILPIIIGIRKKKANVRVAVVGKGSFDDSRRFREIIEKEGLENNFVFPFDLNVGAPNQEELWRVLRACRVLIHPSHSDTWGIIIAEALACGVPIVTYDLDAIRTVFGGNEDVVFLTPFMNYEKAATVALELLKESQKNENELARRCTSAAKQFDWNAVASQKAALFRSFTR